MQHLVGNLRSRFTDFLTSDGEKPDRHRDSEFAIEPADTRESLWRRWEEEWGRLFATLEPLTPRHQLLGGELALRDEAPRRHGLQPHRMRQFKLSNDPAFTTKLRDIVGLYVDPPAHAVVLSVDEKSQIQALNRTQPGLPMKPLATDGTPRANGRRPSASFRKRRAWDFIFQAILITLTPWS